MEELTCLRRVCLLFTLCIASVLVSAAQNFKTLVTFDQSNGASPGFGSLVQATNGDLYGTTAHGGASNDGTIFKITLAGVLTTLDSFDRTNGTSPEGGLVQATNGYLYGTTKNGPFKITPAGVLTTFPGFEGGAMPEYGSLVQATNGDLYGTTVYGGANGDGTIFKITPAGVLTTLHSFDGTDGAFPYAGLVQATNGDLYGTTEDGGASNGGGACEYGCGTIFKITPAGMLTSLHSFDLTDGAIPRGGLMQATNGYLYGTTVEGGASAVGGANSYGTIFKITPAGVLTSLHSFDLTDGDQPYAGLIQASDGNLYGTTEAGGAYDFGTIFKITPAGVLTSLYSFYWNNGASPGGLVQATNGNLYGTTTRGAATGTIFRLSVGLGPFVNTLPISGEPGSVVKILGTNLTGSTSVSFNGTLAVFTVVDPALITTTVPTGATTGTVQVITPSGTFSSNVPFRVP
jgi:uncharacterized repeat protein (TIGR03803 family)